MSEEDNPLGPLPTNISLHDHPLWGLSKHLLLLGRIFVSKWDLRPNIKVQTFTPTVTNVTFSYKKTRLTCKALKLRTS